MTIFGVVVNFMMTNEIQTACFFFCQANEAAGGTWYRKSDIQQQEFAGREKNKKDQKKEGKEKGNAKQDSSV